MFPSVRTAPRNPPCPPEVPFPKLQRPPLGFKALRFSDELRVDYFTTSVLCFDGSKQGDWQHTKGYLLVAQVGKTVPKEWLPKRSRRVGGGGWGGQL